jgi:hypothetical protein
LGTRNPRVGSSTSDVASWVDADDRSQISDERFYAVSQELTVVPVPAAVWLLGGGLIGLLGIRRRFKK